MSKRVSMRSLSVVVVMAFAIRAWALPPGGAPQEKRDRKRQVGATHSKAPRRASSCLARSGETPPALNLPRITKQLQRQFGKDKQLYQGIFPNNADAPTEVVCEVDPTARHPEFSKAVAIISRSQPHHHQTTTETYRGLRGKTVVTVDGKDHILRPGQSLIIQPGQVHSARAMGRRPAWIEALSSPGWTPADQLVAP